MYKDIIAKHKEKRDKMAALMFGLPSEAFDRVFISLVRNDIAKELHNQGLCCDEASVDAIIEKELN